MQILIFVSVLLH